MILIRVYSDKSIEAVLERPRLAAAPADAPIPCPGSAQLMGRMRIPAGAGRPVTAVGVRAVDSK
jgi:hypothetical protein